MTCSIPTAAILVFASGVPESEKFPDAHQLAALAHSTFCELAEKGFTPPSPAYPVRIYAMNSLRSSPEMAGGWRPGVIGLRTRLREGLSAQTYLRHEAMHEASFRSCGGRLPLWTEEAHAMNFSGEILADAKEHATETEMASLADAIERGEAPSAEGRRALAAWLRAHPMPLKPCAAPVPPAALAKGGELSYRVIDFLSTREVESRGDQSTPRPPGSLLKLPWAACLASPRDSGVGKYLAQSNTHELSALEKDLDKVCLGNLLEGAGLRIPKALSVLAPRELLGFRDPKGEFPLEGSLTQLALLMRAALWELGAPATEALADFSTGSTLAEASPEARAALKRLEALAKTGTVADPRGRPLWGYLALAWPQREPRFTAIIRQEGVNGFTAANHSVPILQKLRALPESRKTEVRVQVGSRLPRQALKIQSPCPELSARAREKANTCGYFIVKTEKNGESRERILPGILEDSERSLVLHTDAETYADGVLNAEAAAFGGAAREALRAIIVWNAMKSSEEKDPLCDTTRCMVFSGVPRKTAASDSTRLELLRMLDSLVEPGRRWLSFSLGGRSAWKKSLSAQELAARMGEPSVMDVRLVRTGAQTEVELDYTESSERISCEVFRNRLRLLSCPQSIQYLPNESVWRFTGIGEGHGEGLSLIAAQEMAGQGFSAESILRMSFR